FGVSPERVLAILKYPETGFDQTPLAVPVVVFLKKGRSLPDTPTFDTEMIVGLQSQITGTCVGFQNSLGHFDAGRYTTFLHLLDRDQFVQLDVVNDLFPGI